MVSPRGVEHLVLKTKSLEFKGKETHLPTRCIQVCIQIAKKSSPLMREASSINYILMLNCGRGIYMSSSHD